MIRHKIYQILIIIFAFTLSACEETFVEAFGVENPSGEVVPPQEEPVIIVLGEVITNVATDITESSVKLSGEIVSKGNSDSVEVGFLLYTGSETNFEINTSGVEKYVASVSGNSFSKSITSLTSSTKYKFRAYIKNEAGISYGQVKNFTTETGITQGEVITNAATEITSSQARLNGDLVSTGNSNNYTIGFILYTGSSNNFTLTTSGVQNFEVPNSKSLFNKLVTNLTENTTYKFRAYITNEEGTSYGTVKTFTTEVAVTQGQVTTNDATNITTTTATLNGVLNSTGNSTNYTVGFLLYSGNLSTFTLTTSGVLNYTITASGTTLSKALTNLNDNTNYKFRTYITNEAGTSYGDVKTFTTRTIVCLQTLTGHTHYVESASYSPDGTKIVSASGDNTIKIWDANTGSCLQTLTGHTSLVYSASYSPDGTKIVSASADDNIKIWDANTGTCLKTLTGHTDWVESASYSPDGTKIVSAS
ncbi:MAG: WD40 repeat domain-containing protein, partial [Bacteroidales bacterium]|nr:WD40 repeat domain-containing protein [Bacteroidales bacterium]